MNIYRSHNCDELRKKDVGKKILLSGWINKKRDHGNLLFIDLRDNYGVTQCIIDKENSNFEKLEKLQLETVIKIDGKVVKRIHRSYSKIFDFIYKIDEMSLKKKKPININLVKEILGE